MNQVVFIFILLAVFSVNCNRVDVQWFVQCVDKKDPESFRIEKDFSDDYLRKNFRIGELRNDDAPVEMKEKMKNYLKDRTKDLIYGINEKIMP